MPAEEVPLIGDELFAAVTEAMVAFHQRYHHRKPVTARTVLLGDDLLGCMLGGVYTHVKKTMIEIQRLTMVQETRNAFQNAMQDKFIKAVERLSGRHVLAFFSNHHVGPRQGNRAIPTRARRDYRTGPRFLGRHSRIKVVRWRRLA
jgi:uncharacterized protein YbcI